MNSSDPLMEMALAVLVSAFVGSYFAGYLRKKGENLATHEDIDKLITQVAAVTTATKEIEAKITGDVWDRQKRWELRREVLFEAMKRASDLDDALLSLDSVLKVELRDQKRDDDLNWLEVKTKRLMNFETVSTAFAETGLFVGVVCGKEAKEAFDAFGIFTNAIAIGINTKDQEIYNSSRLELAKKLAAVRAVIRKELGIDG